MTGFSANYVLETVQKAEDTVGTKRDLVLNTLSFWYSKEDWH